MAGWCFQSCAPRCPKERGRKGTDHLLLTHRGCRGPTSAQGGGAGRRQLGFKVRLFLKWRRRRAEKGRPQGEVYGSVPQGPTLSRGWRPQLRCGGGELACGECPGRGCWCGRSPAHSPREHCLPSLRWLGGQCLAPCWDGPSLGPAARLAPWHGGNLGLWCCWMLRSGVCVALATSLSPIMF